MQMEYSDDSFITTSVASIDDGSRSAAELVWKCEQKDGARGETRMGQVAVQAFIVTVAGQKYDMTSCFCF